MGGPRVAQIEPLAKTRGVYFDDGVEAPTCVIGFSTPAHRCQRKRVLPVFPDSAHTIPLCGAQ